METDAIRITGIIAEEVGHPRNDGSRGSGLYKVPLRLSRTPSRTWAELFVRTWDQPPRFTSMHRPGIARVHSDSVILDGTTVEEVERYHIETLKHVVASVNEEAANIAEREADQRAREAAERQEHDANVRDVASRVRFDDQ